MQGLLTLLTFLSPFITTQKNYFTVLVDAWKIGSLDGLKWEFR